MDEANEEDEVRRYWRETHRRLQAEHDLRRFKADPSLLEPYAAEIERELQAAKLPTVPPPTRKNWEHYFREQFPSDEAPEGEAGSRERQAMNYSRLQAEGRLIEDVDELKKWMQQLREATAVRCGMQCQYEASLKEVVKELGASRKALERLSNWAESRTQLHLLPRGEEHTAPADGFVAGVCARTLSQYAEHMSGDLVLVFGSVSDAGAADRPLRQLIYCTLRFPFNFPDKLPLEDAERGALVVAISERFVPFARCPQRSMMPMLLDRSLAWTDPDSLALAFAHNKFMILLSGLLCDANDLAAEAIHIAQHPRVRTCLIERLKRVHSTARSALLQGNQA